MNIETIVESFINGQLNQMYSQFKEYDDSGLTSCAVDDLLDHDMLNDTDKLRMISAILYRVESL